MAYYDSKTQVFLNGKWIKATDANVTLYNQTMHYGNGVFEGIRSYETTSGARIFKAKEHYDRLLFSCDKMHIPFEYSVDDLIEISYTLLEKNGLTNAYIRPLVYLEPNMTLEPVDDSSFFMCAWNWGKYLGDRLLNLMTSSYQRPNPKSCHVEAKTVGHYINSILATTEARLHNFDEALLLDMNGKVAEGPGANFFVEKDGIISTCPLGNILPGITRNTILELADQMQIQINERYFTIEEVKNGDSAFFTGTAAEVIGVAKLDDYVFPLNWEYSKGAQLSKAYQALVRDPKNL